jgi:hypothetical protein
MKKRLSVVSKAAAAAQVLGISLLLMISCANILAPPREAAGNGEIGTALISFGNGVEGARTLLPTGVTFERYDLTIEAVFPNIAATEYATISSGSSATVELAIGDWTIHVDAYTDAEGQNKAAEGDSEAFTVSSNATTPVNVTLKAVSGPDNGTLSVDITGEDGVIGYGWLYIYEGTEFIDPVYFDNGSYSNTYADFPSSGLTLDIPLPSGQYRIFVEIRNNEGHRAFINEVAYIYSNLTTPLDRVMEAGDFVDTATISGTVQYVENGVDQNNYTFAVFANSEGTGDYLDSVFIYSIGEELYTLHIPRPDKTVTLYFFINKDTNWFFADSFTFTAGQASVTKNISVNRSAITLGGSVAVTVNGNEPSYVGVYAYSEGGGSPIWATVSDGTWTISGIPDDFSGTLKLRIYAAQDEQSYEADTGSWTPGEATDNIPLTASFITVSGSFTATENSIPISNVYVYINAYRESVPGSGKYEYLEGNSNYNWNGTTCYWTFGTVGLSLEVQVQINIDIGGNMATETVTVGTVDVTIPPTTYAFTSITLSGTIGTVTINGQTPDYVSVYARTSDNDYYWSSVYDDGNWEIPLPDGFLGTVVIMVQAGYEGRGQEKNVYTQTVSGSSVTGINLGNVDIISIILSGAIGTVTVNGKAPDYVYIYARTPDNHVYTGFVENSRWQISLPGDVSEVTIAIRTDYQEGQYGKDVAAWKPGDSTTIDLGDIMFTLTPIGGTVTTDGSTPLGSGYLVILSQSVSSPEEVTEEMLLGNAEIVGGDFLGYVNSGVTSGYVAVYEPNTGDYWIASSSATLSSSMSINLSTMEQGQTTIPDDPVGGGGDPAPAPRGAR